MVHPATGRDQIEEIKERNMGSFEGTSPSLSVFAKIPSPTLQVILSLIRYQQHQRSQQL
jgi:hypothetical protein